MLLAYHAVRRELRGIVLLLGSYLFYAWAEPKALLILLGVTLLSYVFALLLQHVNKSKKALRITITAIALLADI